MTSDERSEHDARGKNGRHSVHADVYDDQTVRIKYETHDKRDENDVRDTRGRVTHTTRSTSKTGATK